MVYKIIFPSHFPVINPLEVLPVYPQQEITMNNMSIKSRFSFSPNRTGNTCV